MNVTNRLSESAREVLVRALRIAMSEGHNYVNVEHIRKAITERDEAGLR